MPSPAFQRPEHAGIARLLRRLRTDLFTDSQCWFAGGTAVVMAHGEYRLSLDVDFLCSSQDGYRALRQTAVARGSAGLFAEPVRELREIRCDQYGLRTVLEIEGRPVKFEIVREARIDLSGAFDAGLGCPVLSVDDQIAEKMLANSDRGRDPSVCYRDALDLGVLALARGDRIPAAASEKAMAAYGQDVWRDARWVVDHLQARPAELERAAHRLGMDPGKAEQAMAAVGRACDRQERPRAGAAGEPGRTSKGP